MQVTLETLATASDQDVFDHVVRSMVEQDRQQSMLNGTRAYRGATHGGRTTRCAALIRAHGAINRLKQS